MTKPLPQFDWNQARAFLVTAEKGSLSAAARELRLTQPTLSRQVAGLEADLGLVLFERLGRRLHLTKAGQDVLAHFRAMGAAADMAGLSARWQSDAVEGRVSITATDVFAAYILPEILQNLRRVAPGIEIEVNASNSLQDLRRREADIALRNVQPDQAELISHRVANTTGHLYGASRYIDHLGRPKALTGLSQANFIAIGSNEPMHSILIAAGVPLTARSYALTTNSGVALWQMVRAGLGLTLMAKDVADRSPEVEPMFTDKINIPVPLWLTTHREMHTSRRIRVVFDFLADALGNYRP